MDELATTIDTYIAAWTEPDPARRAELVARVWDGDGRLIDPPFAAAGHGQIGDMGRALQEQYPGHRFRRVSGIDAHHGQFRFAWELIAPGGAVVLAGQDVGEVGEDGRLRRITGFFGPLPEHA